MGDCVGSQSVIFVANAERPITDFGKHAAGEIAAENALDLPHQIRADAEDVIRSALSEAGLITSRS